jgi:hypothetical protein
MFQAMGPGKTTIVMINTSGVMTRKNIQTFRGSGLDLFTEDTLPVNEY